MVLASSASSIVTTGTVADAEHYPQSDDRRSGDNVDGDRVGSSKSLPPGQDKKQND